MRAKLQSPLSKLSVDREKRMISGVRVMEVNKDVTYKGADGKAVSFRTNAALLSGLIAHAGNRTIPSHLSHEWADGKRDALFDRIGGIKNCRLSDAGDLIADMYAMPGDAGDRVLWLAENDPEHCALSCIFDYNPIRDKDANVTYAHPLNFESADLVAKGAAVTALLSQTTDTDMTKEEITALFDERLTAALKNFKPEGYITAAESEQRIKAALSAHKPEPVALTEDQLAKLSATAADAAEQKVVAKLGVNAGMLQNLKDQSDKNSTYKATLAKYVETANGNKALAVARMLKDKPELSDAHDAALQEQVEAARKIA